MKWVTRERPKIDRIACPWLITRFIDAQPEFLYVPAAQVFEVAKRTGAVVKGLNRAGEEQVVEARGLLARCFQHEMDHLEGTVFVDRLRGLQKDLIVRKIKKLTRAGKW